MQRYAALKDKLVKSFVDIAKKKLRKLLNEVDLGDRRRSEKLETHLSHGKSQASRNSRRNRSRSQLESKSCWYHRYFGGKATKCTQLETSETRTLKGKLSPGADSLAMAARRLIVRDRVIGIKFLVDTEADVSIPVLRHDCTHISD
ncbi:hypothetical protein ALC53_01978 [Atta colombica]|uniref:Peptidase A2 domain-containing protein n=1 Tax=Atta colombica TaxID=520822 RepID=A0A195BTA7_9HYME|nr:hypothetical protein ALC53_01978 [Atta colombica]